MMADSFFQSLVPEEEVFNAGNHIDTDHWVIKNLSYYDTQRIRCSYPVSGSYTQTPRYIYYVFILVALFGRKSAWLTNAALGLVMTLSSAAAFHGIILAAIRRNMAPSYLSENRFSEVVQVDGPTFANHMTDELFYNNITHESWLPILPMVRDHDGSAVLAIVGAAFLVLLPMQIWSSTLREAGIARTLVGLWSCLLLSGLISALIYVEYTIFWAFRQFRFCPPGAADTLPFSNKGPYNYLPNRTHGDRYRWNRVVGEQYVYRNATIRFPDICIYPCFEYEWLLRDPEDIHVGPAKLTSSSANLWALTIIYFMVASSCICNLCLLLATHTKFLMKYDWGIDHTLVAFIRKRQFRDLLKRACTKRTRTTSSLHWAWRAVVAFIFWYVSLFAIVMSPITLVAFVAVCETILLPGKSGVETFRHVGQWGALISAVLVLLSALGPALGSWLSEPVESRIQKAFRAC